MWYDLLIFAILAYCMIRGAMKGVVWQLAIIGALVLCFAFAEPLSVVLAPVISVDPPLNRWLAMLGIYLGFSFVSFAVAQKLRSWIEAWKFVEYDRHIGAIFGLIKGVVFCLVLTFFIVTLSDKMRFEVLNSHSGHAAAVFMDRLHPVMPAELHEVLEPYIHQLDKPHMNLEHGHENGLAEQDPHDVVGPASSDQGANAEMDKWMAMLPQEFDDTVRQIVRTALENTAPEDRQDLLERLRPVTPDLLRQIATQWQNGKLKSLPLIGSGEKPLTR